MGYIWNIFGKRGWVKGGEGGGCINIRFIDKKKMLYKFVYNMFIKINDFYYN